MLTEKRYEDILKLVDQQRTVTVTNLSERLGASESTIRRDLLALDRMGKLVRVHGGATSIDCQYTTKDLKLDERYGMSMTEKRAIALVRRCARGGCGVALVGRPSPLRSRCRRRRLLCPGDVLRLRAPRL